MNAEMDQAIAEPVQQDTNSTEMRSVDCRWLLALYAVIPLTLAFVVTDILLLDGQLFHSMPADPARWAFWTVVFGLPHIIASLITMADRDYLSHYRKSLLWPLLFFAGISFAGVFGPQPLSYDLLFILLAFYTIYHVLAQQLGLTLMMMGIAPSTCYRWWKWLSILAGTAVYMMVFGAHLLRGVYLGPFALESVLTLVSGLLCIAVVALALRLMDSSKNTLGLWYMWGNVALVVSAFFVNELGYTLFVILMPRIVHDITAYMVYVTHDTNRNKAKPVNWVYRATHFTRLPPVLLLPLLSIGLAYALTSYQKYAMISAVVITVSLLHYYFEGFIWRGPNPHRAHLVFRR